ncbi:MAG: AAA family ATPase [Ghiorsea sp.]|nr:AAA family ATPase [Ghiorsea sp.]
MYNNFFGFKEKPFTIAPNPQYLYMSKRHQEALAHMLYGLRGEGGVMVLTGEVGTGKTTICRSLLNQLPENTDVAYIINPRQSETEMLASLCDELHIACVDPSSIKSLTDALNQYLLSTHARGRHTVLIIDEAQNLEIAVLEQLRLLTNLETNDKKLLQIMLLGQPELSDILQRQDLRQFAQRITSRYHLTPLDKDEVAAYVNHRLAIAGCDTQTIFSKAVLDVLFKYSAGIPRLINLIADRALLGAYASENKQVSKIILQQAKQEVLGETSLQVKKSHPSTLPYLLVLTVSIAALWTWNETQTAPSPHVQTTTKPAKEIVKQTASPSKEKMPKSQYTPSIISKNDAFIPLFKTWGITYHPATDGDACAFARTQQLACLRQRGDLAAMRNLDRPAVLTISDEAGQTVYAAITSLTGVAARVVVQDIYTEIPLNQLALQSHNDFTLLWKTPQAYDAPVRPGHQGKLVALLAEQVTQALNQSWIGTPRTVYDETLKEQVKILQRQEGLNPDGVAGPLTWIHINRLNHIVAPNLRKAVP